MGEKTRITSNLTPQIQSPGFLEKTSISIAGMEEIEKT